MGKQLPFFLLVLVLVMASVPTLQGSWRILQVVPSLQTAPGPSAPSSSPSPWTGPSAPGSSPSTAPGPSAPSSSPSPEFPTDTPPPPTPPSGGSGGSGNGGGGGGGGSSGLSGGQKAGIVIGVLAGAGLIVFAALVYMKRRSNIRRARFGVFARRSEL